VRKISGWSLPFQTRSTSKLKSPFRSIGVPEKTRAELRNVFVITRLSFSGVFVSSGSLRHQQAFASIEATKANVKEIKMVEKVYFTGPPF
jgi:hypothetical protein